jgi:membrane-associated phospholipid phosphatase
VGEAEIPLAAQVAADCGAQPRFWSGYAWLGRHAVFQPWTPPQTWFDRVIPFQPQPWGWIYLSQFIFTGGLPWLIDTKEFLRRYSVGLTVMSLACFVVFLFFPVASPRPAALDASGAMAVIIGYDGPWNAFPSLHAGFLIYMGRLAWRMFGRETRVTVGVIAVSWGGAILFATIATRQHYALDLIAGALIGAASDWIAWRRYVSRNAVTTMARSNGVMSQEGCK